MSVCTSVNINRLESTINGESFAGLNFRGFNPMKYFVEILSWFIGQECSQS